MTAPESRGRTGRRIRRRSTSLNYLPMGSGALREDEILARLWGCQPPSAHQRKQKLPDLLADVIRVRREAGTLESLAAYLRPVEDALAHQPQPEEAEYRAARADCAEDDAEATYRRFPSEANARLLLRKRALERQSSIDHDRIIAERWEIVP